MSDQSVPDIDLDDNEYVRPGGDVPGVPASQLVPPTPPQTVRAHLPTGVPFVRLAVVQESYTRLHQMLGVNFNDALIMDKAADDIERLRQEKKDLEEILAVATNPTL